ncbi:von Willebrand factor-like isoform 1-T1 [Rhinophrynus dorsalis]
MKIKMKWMHASLLPILAILLIFIEGAENYSCPNGSKWSACANCSASCENDISCSTECKPGCVCKRKGYVIHGQKCIPRDDCPNYPCPLASVWSNCTSCSGSCDFNNMNCASKCKPGCVCKQEGYVFYEGNCIPKHICPFIPRPRPTDRWCPQDTKWIPCTRCIHFCPGVNKACDKICRRGCVCTKGGHVLYREKCIQVRKCPTSSKNVEVCPSHAMWSSCIECGDSCFPQANCDSICKGGCVCKKRGQVFHEGICIYRNECPSDSLLPKWKK